MPQTTQRHPSALFVHDPRRLAPQAIKPDGVQRQLVGEVISRFEKKGYKLVAMKVGARLLDTTNDAAQSENSGRHSRVTHTCV